MAKVSTCLIFNRQAEEAFQFYKSVFKTEFAGPIREDMYRRLLGATEAELVSETKVR